MQQLTIQLVTWNSAAALRKSLPTLQQVDSSIALLRFIDNASTDESVALIRTALPSAEIVELPRNTGFAGGHNEGFRRCTTPFVLILNPDVELVVKNIPALLAGMQDASVGALQGKLYREGDIIDSTGVLITAAFNGREQGAGEKDEGQFNDMQHIDGVTGACALFRLSAVRAVAHSGSEVFDADFWAYKEDVDLSWRLRRAGWKILYVPLTAGIHPRSLKTEGVLGWSLAPTRFMQRLRNPRTRFSLRNWLWMIAKNATWGEVITHSPWIVARAVVLLALSLLYWPLFRGWWQAVQGLPAMIAKRSISH